jgi:hypothetical protein
MVTPSTPTHLGLLLFWSGNTRWAIDESQVKRIERPSQKRESQALILPFHQWLGNPPVSPDKDPYLLTPKHSKTGKILQIDQLEDIQKISLKKIFPLPPILKGRAGLKEVWGVVFLEGSPIYLLDLAQM